MPRKGAGKNLARVLRKRMTLTEQAMWKRLRDSRLGYKFRRQHPIAGYIVDFYCPSCRVCVELDGESHQIYRTEADGKRDDALLELGILTLRFQNHEFALDAHACCERIRAAFESRHILEDVDDEGDEE